MNSWNSRSRTVVGIILVAVAAFVASSMNGEGSLSTFLVFLAWMLLIVGLAVGALTLFRRVGRKDSGQDSGQDSGRGSGHGLSRTQLAMVGGLLAFAVYAAVDASRSNGGYAVAFVVEMLLGLVVVSGIVLVVDLVRRRRTPAPPATE